MWSRQFKLKAIGKAFEDPVADMPSISPPATPASTTATDSTPRKSEALLVGLAIAGGVAFSVWCFFAQTKPEDQFIGGTLGGIMATGVLAAVLGLLRWLVMNWRGLMVLLVVAAAVCAVFWVGSLLAAPIGAMPMWVLLVLLSHRSA